MSKILIDLIRIQMAYLSAASYCGNCLWMGCEDILGNGWCYKKDCETSCDKVCKKHEF